MPTALFDNAVTGGKSQTCSLANTLGREKGFEYPRPHFRAHSSPCICDGKHDVVARLQFRISAGVLRAKGDIRSFKGNFAAVWHGFMCVQDDVHNYLFKLARV